jgi:hypothetical protein
MNILHCILFNMDDINKIDDSDNKGDIIYKELFHKIKGIDNKYRKNIFSQKYHIHNIDDNKLKNNNEFINIIIANEISNGEHNINNMINQNPDIIQLFNIYYPELKFEQMCNELKKDIIYQFIDNTLYNFNNPNNPNNSNNSNNEQENMINKNMELAEKYIPEMLLPQQLIYLNGKINNIQIKILVDTGATINCIFKSKIIEAGLDNIVDKYSKSNIQGINSNNEMTYGKLWYTEIELESKSQNNDKIYEIIRLNLQIMDENENSKKFDVILGLNFMKSYKANIDFSTNTITFNNTIKINFD